ncbi:ABC transporter permease subunit [Rhizobium calliandrae]|uniref:ABC transporter permease subunit n=1 Tax=Rhizobium calliandrae TaxID=1312182 RepID=A0ABT7KLC7_9HYPH|nr:ABC transporter permease subunit [Rhizobium calliandrae]MDL2408068.1 ABC transporter permease subunit [Rhizobium calliandrae]
MDLSILVHYWPTLLGGFKLTVFCWVLGTVFSMVLGLIISLAQRYGPRPFGWLLRAYIEVIRGTPFLVQLFVLYYGGPLLGLRLDALPAGILGLTVYGSPYFAEIFRAG